ncbi:MAG: hypothetical protein PHR26_03570, partial [Candidatus ainarchaeum sp.]|nr:hypothetical protein [Candidatus ainarchaeum sp.]
DEKILFEITKQLEKVESEHKRTFLQYGVANVLEQKPSLEALSEITKQLEKVESEHKENFLQYGVANVLEQKPSLEALSEITKQLEKVESEHKENFLYYGVANVLEQKPSLEALSEITKQLEKVESEHKDYFLQYGVANVLEQKPSLIEFKQDILLFKRLLDKNISLELFNIFSSKKYIEYTQNRRKNYKNFRNLIESINSFSEWKTKDLDIYSGYNLTAKDTDKNFSFRLKPEKFKEIWNKYNNYNEKPILSTSLGKKNITFSLKQKQESKLRLTSKLNPNVINKYINMIDTSKRTNTQRYMTILQLENPTKFKENMKKNSFVRQIESLNNKQLLEKINETIIDLAKQNKHSLIKPVLEQAMPLILENRNISLNTKINLENLEEARAFITNLSEFLGNDLKEYVKENISLSEKDLNKINETLETTRKTYKGKDEENNIVYKKEKVPSDLELERKKFKVEGGTKKEEFELQTSKTVMDALCGQTGETCLSTNYDVSFIENENFQPITIINKKTKKADGSIYAYLTKVNGKKAIVSLGIEPKMRMVNDSSSATKLTETLVEALKKVAEINGIKSVYISGESGEVSNRNDVLNYLNKKYIENKQSISKKIRFPENLKIRKLYRIL